MTVSPKFVTVATFSKLPEAQVAKSRLEASGIDCLIQDEHTAAIYNPVTLGAGISLQVAEEDFQTAIKILNSSSEIT